MEKVLGKVVEKGQAAYQRVTGAIQRIGVPMPRLDWDWAGDTSSDCLSHTEYCGVACSECEALEHANLPQLESKHQSSESEVKSLPDGASSSEQDGRNKDRYLVQINDHQSIVSIDEDERIQRQIEGDDVMILSLIQQTERISMTPSKSKLTSAKKFRSTPRKEVNPSCIQKDIADELQEVDGVLLDTERYHLQQQQQQSNQQSQYPSKRGFNMTISPYKYRDPVLRSNQASAAKMLAIDKENEDPNHNSDHQQLSQQEQPSQEEERQVLQQTTQPNQIDEMSFTSKKRKISEISVCQHVLEKRKQMESAHSESQEQQQDFPETIEPPTAGIQQIVLAATAQFQHSEQPKKLLFTDLKGQKFSKSKTKQIKQEEEEVKSPQAPSDDDQNPLLVKIESQEQTKSVFLDDLLARYQKSEWLESIKQALLNKTQYSGELSSITLDSNYYGPDPVLHDVTINDAFCQEILPKLSLAVDATNFEQLPREFYTRKELQADSVTQYAELLNSKFPSKAVIILCPDLSSQIVEHYSDQTKTNSQLQKLVNQVHQRTNGTLLSCYTYVLCVFKDDNKFDFVEVDHSDREIKGKGKDVNVFLAFYQEYLHATKSQRRSGQQVSNDGQGFEDNLTLWNIVKHDIEDCGVSYEPCEAILKMREICHLAKPKLDDVSLLSLTLNDSIDSQNKSSPPQQAKFVRKRTGRLGRKREIKLLSQSPTRGQAAPPEKLIEAGILKDQLSLVFKLEILLDTRLV